MSTATTTIAAQVRAIVETYSTRRIDNDDQLLMTLGIDSLDKFEIGMECEDEFAIVLEDEFLAGVSTVRDLIALCERVKKGGAA